MFLEPNYKGWAKHFATISQLALEKERESTLMQLGPGSSFAKGRVVCWRPLVTR